MTRDMPFDRQALQQALHELGRRAHAEGKSIEIAIYGGSALILTFDWRIATRDVEESPDVDDIRHLAGEIGITSSKEALRLVAEFDPSNILEPKVRFGLEEILASPPDTPLRSESSEP